MLSQVHLKSILSYNPKTGVFTWLVGKRMGTIAGSLHWRGHRHIKIDQKKYHASRLAFLYMMGKFPEKEVDHKNRVRDDDTWDNLRDVSHSTNERNKGLRPSNTSGCTGVSWFKPIKRWHVRIKVEGRSISLKYFKNKTDAIRVRQEAEKKYGGLM